MMIASSIPISNRMPVPRASPSPTSRMFDSGTLPFRTASASDFQVERTPKQSIMFSSRRGMPRSPDNSRDELLLREHASRLLAAKHRPFTTGGRIPLEASELVLFFRSKSGITHSLDFPIDVEYDTPPALDVLIAACRPHPSDLDDYSDRESLFYPPNLPLTMSLQLSNHPILEAIRNTLFPLLPVGHYLTATRDKLEILVGGGRMNQQNSIDGRAATIILTLPVRFRGGAMIVHDPDGRQEKFYGRGGKPGDIEWTAFLADCGYEVETVDKGCRVSISYGVYLRTFGPSGLHPDPLITPSDGFMDLLSPILNITRGRKIAFYLANDYEGVDPSEVLADTLVPDASFIFPLFLVCNTDDHPNLQLKGGDSILYHAMKLYKLTPELHWTAGGYIWPVDVTIDIPKVARVGSPPIRGTFSNFEDITNEDLRARVQDSGAIPVSESDIVLLNDWNSATPVGKERLAIVSNGELEKLVVNVLLMVYVA